jgi:homoserine kinase type II
MTIVYKLYHIYNRGSDGEGDDDEETKLIGIYSTKEKAEAAILRVKDKPGFRDYPDGFEIFEHTLDRDGWVDGFTTVW